MQLISYCERQQIEILLRGKTGIRAIARKLGRAHSDISREIRRNKKNDERYYCAKAAEERAKVRSRKTNKRKLDTDMVLRDSIIQKLKEDWSPEQIAGRLKNCAKKDGLVKERTISHESIYDWIYRGEGRFMNVYSHLRRGRKKRRKQRARRPQKELIQGRISIRVRPEEINRRSRVGDWESDSMVFKKQREALSVQYERKIMLTKIHRVNNKSAEATENALVWSMESLPADVWKTITFDNGGEAANHLNLRKMYGIDTYFCDAYASWQKGGVENTNGLIRQYFPKDFDISAVTNADILRAQERINNRPRKKLNYLTPNEALKKHLREVVH